MLIILYCFLVQYHCTTMAGKPKVELSLKEKVNVLVAAETVDRAEISHRKLATLLVKLKLPTF